MKEKLNELTDKYENLKNVGADKNGDNKENKHDCISLKYDMKTM